MCIYFLKLISKSYSKSNIPFFSEPLQIDGLARGQRGTGCVNGRQAHARAQLNLCGSVCADAHTGWPQVELYTCTLTCRSHESGCTYMYTCVPARDPIVNRLWPSSGPQRGGSSKTFYSENLVLFFVVYFKFLKVIKIRLHVLILRIKELTQHFQPCHFEGI